MGRLFWIIWVSLMSSQGLYRGKSEAGETFDVGFEDGQRGHEPRSTGASGGWKRPGSRLSSHASRMQPCEPFRSARLQDYKIINLLLF